MKFCPNCKDSFEEDYGFCLQDGTPLVDSLTEEASKRKKKTHIKPDKSQVSDETLVLPAHYSISDDITVEDFSTAEEKSIKNTSKKKPSQSSLKTEKLQKIPALGSKNNSDEDKLKSTVSTAQIQPPTNSETQNTYSKPMVGGVTLLFLIMIGTAIGGTYLYMQSQSATEIVATNKNKRNELTLTNPIEKTSANTSNQNTQENASNSNLENVSSTNADINENKKEEITKNEIKPTPKPSDRQKTEPTSTKTKTPTPTATKTPNPTPTPTAAPEKPKKPNRVSGGVLNGKAIRLPKARYLPTARRAGAKGQVKVAVLVNKDGRVVSARPISGDSYLHSQARVAAFRALFRPRIVDGQAVEVTGILIYHFPNRK